MPRRADLTSIGMGRFARRDVIANDRLVPLSVRRMAMVLRRPSTVETNTATAPERPVVRTASRSSPAGGPGILESGEVVHRLTDQVIHAIDHRIIAEGLKTTGFADAEIAKVMGGNWLSFFDQGFGGSEAVRQ